MREALTRRAILASGVSAMAFPWQGQASASMSMDAVEKRPAALSDRHWPLRSNWNFGTAPGNNIRRFGDLLAQGWYMDPTPTYLNKECETYNNLDTSDRNANFQAFPDHCDIVAIWNGGPIAAASGNGSITSLMLRYDLPDGPAGAPSAAGYYELTAKVPSVGGAWPAWWTIGHPARTGRGSHRWGPEIDIFEFNNTDTKTLWSTLHKGQVTPSYCFMRAGTIPPQGDPPAFPKAPHTTYQGAPWNCGSFAYAPGVDFAQGFHRYGLKIDNDYKISIWVDDVEVGLFAADQYCDDQGRPVSVELLVNLAVGVGDHPVATIDQAAFGGPRHAGPGNKFRLGLKNIQVWGP